MFLKVIKWKLGLNNYLFDFDVILLGVDAFMLNSATPNARIQINSSDGVFVVNVELPPPSIDSLEEEPQQFKVSLHLLAMQLCEPSVAFNGDRLKVIYVRYNIMVILCHRKCQFVCFTKF